MLRCLLCLEPIEIKTHKLYTSVQNIYHAYGVMEKDICGLDMKNPLIRCTRFSPTYHTYYEDREE